MQYSRCGHKSALNSVRITFFRFILKSSSDECDQFFLASLMTSEQCFTWFKFVTNSYPLVVFMDNFRKFGAIHCIFCVMIIVTVMQNFTSINIKFHMPLF